MRSVFRRTRSSPIADVIVFAAIVLVILAVLWALPEAGPTRASGSARVIDGDSLFVQGVEIRLKGIDAPELAQDCMRGGRAWPCGREAAAALGRLTRERIVRCSGNERDAHDRLLADCLVGETNVNRWLVANGWAVSFGAFTLEEREARAGKRGIWTGTFVRPRDWREENR